MRNPYLRDPHHKPADVAPTARHRLSKRLHTCAGPCRVAAYDRGYLLDPCLNQPWKRSPVCLRRRLQLHLFSRILNSYSWLQLGPQQKTIYLFGLIRGKQRGPPKKAKPTGTNSGEVLPSSVLVRIRFIPARKRDRWGAGGDSATVVAVKPFKGRLSPVIGATS